MSATAEITELTLAPDELDELREALKGLSDEEARRLSARLLRVLEQLQAAVSNLTQERLETVIDDLMPSLAFPSDAAVRQARRNAQARTELLQEFGALTGEQVAEERSKAKNRHALAARWRKEARLFGVDYRGQILYPEFQFDDVGETRPVVKRVLAELPRDRMSDWEVALWWTAENGWLDGRRPVDLLDEAPEEIVEAARQLSAPSPL